MLRTWTVGIVRLLWLAMVAVGASGRLTVAAQAPVAVVSVLPTQAHLVVGDTTTVYVQVDNVANLYGVDVQLGFNTAILQVVDADTTVPGVQVRPWPSLTPAQLGSTITISQTADNSAGTVSLVSAFMNPLPPVTGTTSLLAMTVRAVAPGTATITVTKCELSTPDGDAITHTTAGGTIAITGPVAGFRFTVPGAPVVAGAAFPLTVEAVDSGGTVVAAYNGSAALSSGAGLASPSGALTFAAGVWQGTAVLTTAGPAQTVTATSGSVASTSPGITVIPGPAASVALGANPPAVEVGGSTLLSAKVTDAYGNPVGDGTQVTFACSAGTFLAGGTTANATTTSGVATTTYTGTGEGTAQVTATAASASDSVDVLILAPAPHYQRVMLPLVKLG